MRRHIVGLALVVGSWGCGGGTARPVGKQPVAGRALGPLGVWDHRWLYGQTRDAAAGATAERDLWMVGSDGSGPTRLVERWVAWPAGDSYLIRGGRLFAWGRPAPGAPLALSAFDEDGSLLGAHALVPETTSVREDGAAIGGAAATGAQLLVGPPGALGTVGSAELVTAWTGWRGAELVALVARGGESNYGLITADVASGGSQPLQPGPIVGTCGDHRPCISPVAVGCALDAPACPDGKRPRCLIAYNRPNADGMPRPYAWDQSTMTETRLPELGPTDGFFGSPDGHTLVWHDPTPLEGDENRVWFLDACADRTEPMAPAPNPDRCRVFSGQTITLGFRPDGKAFAFALDEPGDMVSVNLASRPRQCSRVGVSRRIGAFAFSPDSSRMAWIDRSGDPGSVWFGDGLGFARTKLADGDFVPSFVFADDGSRAFVGRSAEKQTSLSWFGLDPYAAANPEHVLTSSHRQLRAGSRRALVIADYNTQEQTGDLVLFDLASDARTTLARAVSAFEVDGAVDDAAPLAYIVHGRMPSNRDGLWIATLPP